MCSARKNSVVGHRRMQREVKKQLQPQEGASFPSSNAGLPLSGHLQLNKSTLGALLAFSAFYGFFIVNYMDLTPRVTLHGYHLFLIVLYFAPFAPLMMVYGRQYLPLLFSMGVLTSLNNDLLYYPASIVMNLGYHGNLASWYALQLGFDGSKPDFTFQAGVTTFTVTSTIMAASIYLRIAAFAIILIYYFKFQSGKKS